jgi:ABC-type uncharacterized transport system ATPase subunit
VETVADRVAILSRGRLVGHGTVDELLAGREERVELCAVGLTQETAARLAALASSHLVRGDSHLFALHSRERADAAVAALVAGGGRLVAFTSQRGTFEDLFVERVQGAADGRGAAR